MTYKGWEGIRASMEGIHIAKHGVQPGHSYWKLDSVSGCVIQRNVP